MGGGRLTGCWPEASPGLLELLNLGSAEEVGPGAGPSRASLCRLASARPGPRPSRARPTNEAGGLVLGAHSGALPPSSASPCPLCHVAGRAPVQGAPLPRGQLQSPQDGSVSRRGPHSTPERRTEEPLGDGTPVRVPETPFHTWKLGARPMPRLAGLAGPWESRPRARPAQERPGLSCFLRSKPVGISSLSHGHPRGGPLYREDTEAQREHVACPGSPSEEPDPCAAGL